MQHHASDYLHTRYIKSTGVGSLQLLTDAPKLYGVALFGLGRAGSIHLGNLIQTPRLRLRYLVDASTERLRDVQLRLCLDESVVLSTDVEGKEVFQDQSVVAVIIATPSALHEPLVTAAILAGKHVLCEKPIALSLDLVKKCYTLAKQCDRILLCAFNRRYDPAFASITGAVRGREIGQVQCISTVSRDSPRPSFEYLRGSGGIFHDCIVHDVDLICHVVGEFPSTAFAASHAFSDDIAGLDDHDTVICILVFPSGVLAHIDISRHAIYGYDQRLEVHGSAGLLRSDNQRPYSTVVSGPNGCTLAPILHSFPSRYSEAYKRQLDHFLALLDGTESLAITESAVLNVSKIVFALEESVKTGKMITVSY